MIARPRNFIVFILVELIHLSQGTPWIPEARTDPKWIYRHKMYKNLTAQQKENIKTVFYGDAHMDGWYGTGFSIFQKNYASFTVNYGISGDRVENLLYRISNGEVEGLSNKTRLVVLLIGANNFQNTEDDTVRGIKAVLDLLRTKLPNSNILLLGLLPGMNNADVFKRHANINSKISKFADKSEKYVISFLDMSDKFAKDGSLQDKALYASDSIHFNKAGYQVWADTMNAWIISEGLL